jgi:hypothetical protein
MILTGACPRTGSAWTSTGRPHEARGLKHRPDGAVRVVPIPAVLVGMLRRHLLHFGSGPDGRLFRGTRGGMLSESVYGRVWHAARQAAALSPALAATALARRLSPVARTIFGTPPCPCGSTPAAHPPEVAARAGKQHPGPARHVPALPRQSGRHRQPADRRRPRRRNKELRFATVRDDKRLCAPSTPPRTLSAICTRTGPKARA